MLIVDVPTVTVKCRTTIESLLIYIILCVILI